MNTRTGQRPRTGATAADIQAHYDIGKDFYALWLDPGLTYSCALWDGITGAPGNTDLLAQAQHAKLRYHLDQAGVTAGGRLLDIGCGWGSLLRTAVEEAGVRQAVGLTLSADQDAHVRSLGLAGVDVELQDWRDHETAERYDGIVSIGAFEHFAHQDMSRDERIGAYRAFFARCAGWLPPLGRLSLQTIALTDHAEHDESVPDFFAGEVFPGSALPRLSEIATACEPYFAITRLREDGADYARTLRGWSSRLFQAREEAQLLVGPDAYLRYRTYLRASEIVFMRQASTLYRITLRRWPERRTLAGASGGQSFSQ
ncbi:cyclopropane-fatty-acyl-phospholipid synthase family protein [Streptomyces sp. TBY4]|uniref:class I SAM-dependent methyltransferase n=1 Tax=Streptomyces sp. TBY4 TaxID=2962030 RepID=UPI0020B84B04|nr:cyclopropane-fatty-acyl-phospholipid synthase family protein [Streptomyces sp. TBY4]MCP3759139.1 cyclopropane-fatty-acyl-phospholipid synthase family protein [Streptomyces sp. TBY4]